MRRCYCTQLYADCKRSNHHERSLGWPVGLGERARSRIDPGDSISQLSYEQGKIMGLCVHVRDVHGSGWSECLQSMHRQCYERAAGNGDTSGRRTPACWSQPPSRARRLVHFATIGLHQVPFNQSLHTSSIAPEPLRSGVSLATPSPQGL
jgi:hypothetical protein